MTKLFYLLVGIILIGGSIYFFLQKPAPIKYIALVSKNLPKAEEKNTTILFTGDIMLDRAIRNVINEKGFDYIFEDIKSIFSGNDLVVGNLEGTITENESVAVKNNNILHFTFATTTAKELKDLGFSGFSLANNHSLDFYQAGFIETKNNLDNAGLFSFGHPLNNQNLSYEQKINGENICFVGYHSLYATSTVNIINEINKIKSECDFLIIFSHWGVEYQDEESEDQRNEAYEFIDNGADLVVGAHPHVIEPIEIYKNKAIFYSLGNFIFDQDFSLRTRQGIVVKVTLIKEKVNFEIIPLEMWKGKLYFPTEENFKAERDLLFSKLKPDFNASLYSKKSFDLIR